MDLVTEQTISERLQSGVMSGKAMLNTFSMLDESSRISAAYSDPRYAPFYYILAQELPVKSILEFGFGIGIASGCYVRGCKTVEHILAFQESGKNYYSSRVGIHNVKNYFKGDLEVYIGKVFDEVFVKKMEARKWELAILNEEQRDYDTLMVCLDTLWESLEIDGTLVVDYVKANDAVGLAYSDFCRSKNRVQCLLPTRYGVGVITR